MPQTSIINTPTVLLDGSMLSAFGTLETGELEPVFQSDFVYGLNTQIWNTATTSGAGATVDVNGGRLRIQCGTNNAGYAYITSKKLLKYRTGQGSVVRMTPLFSPGLANNIQAWGIGYIVSNALYDGYFFGYNGTSFGIFHYNTGVLVKFYPQSQWNGDKCDGSITASFNWNPTFGTPVQIKYPYLGYGNITFYVQNPSTGRWVLCHTINYANTTLSTQLSNPSLQLIGFTLNSGNTTNLTMYCGSVASFVSGERSFVGNPKWAADSAGMAAPGTGQKTIGTTETCFLNLRNCTTYNGIANRGVARINSLSVGSTTSNQNMIVRLLIGATFTTTPVYTPVSGTTADNGVTLTSANSIMSVDVAGTTITSLANRGTFLFNFSIGGTGTQIMDLTPLELFLSPGEILTVSGQASGNTNATASINWSEEV